MDRTADRGDMLIQKAVWTLYDECVRPGRGADTVESTAAVRGRVRGTDASDRQLVVHVVQTKSTLALSRVVVVATHLRLAAHQYRNSAQTYKQLGK